MDAIERETLIEENGYIKYLIEIEDRDLKYCLNFKVYETLSWDGEALKPLETELYLKGTIKWDGCSHMNFGDEGYMHLCGHSYFEDLKDVLDAVWKIAEDRVEGFDKSIAY